MLFLLMSSYSYVTYLLSFAYLCTHSFVFVLANELVFVVPNQTKPLNKITTFSLLVDWILITLISFTHPSILDFFKFLVIHLVN